VVAASICIGLGELNVIVTSNQIQHLIRKKEIPLMLVLFTSIFLFVFLEVSFLEDRQSCDFEVLFNASSFFCERLNMYCVSRRCEQENSEEGSVPAC
jgi:hypothetical protein